MPKKNLAKENKGLFAICHLFIILKLEILNKPYEILKN